MPGSTQWAWMAIALLLALMVLAGVGYVIYRIVKKATKDAYREIRREQGRSPS